MTDSEQDDRLVAERIQRAVARLDPDTASTLTRVTTRGLRIRRRRQVAVRAAIPLALAAAAVATVLVVTDEPTRGKRDVVVPATATPAPAPATSVVGHWVRHIIGDPARDRPESVWVLRIDSPTRGTFQLKPRARMGSGTLVYDPARRVWVVDVIGSRCGGRTGTYTLERFGDDLSFAHVADDCSERVGILDATLFQPATPDDEVPG